MRQMCTHGVWSCCSPDLLQAPPLHQQVSKRVCVQVQLANQFADFFVQDLRKVKFKTFSSKKGGVSANYFEKFADSTSMQDVLAN